MATGNSKQISTDLQLRSLKPTGKTYDVKVKNNPGLVVRVTKKGSKSFRWDRGSGHKPRIITHGSYPTLSLREAQDAHRKAREQHAAGTLSLSRKRKQSDTPRTVSDLSERYFSRIEKTLKRPDIVRRVLDRDILPELGDVRLTALTPVLVSDTIEVVVDRGAAVYAQRVRSILKQMLDMGVSLGLIDSNPAAALSAKFLGIESNERSRKLSSEEIRHLWELLDASKESVLVTSGLKLLLLLGIRSGELRQSRWEHVDLEEGVLIVPVEHQKLKKEAAKKARDFRVPLDSYAISLFRRLQGLHSVWVFPSRLDTIPMNINAWALAVKRIGEIEPFVPHDLRRTMRSGLSELKIPPHVAERCLNHSLGKIVDVYDRYDYNVERRQALEQWSQHVQVVTGQHENVLELRA